VPSVWTRTTLH
jgi:hypothetical protein